jgi:hypothetical protein
LNRLTPTIVLVLVAHWTPQPCHAAGSGRAAFALIIGANRSVDRELRQLHYADDDAVRYFDLFRTLGLRTYLLTRPDKNTRRLHSQAIAEAHLPRRAALERVVRALAGDVAKARRRGLRTTVYVVFAGHGNIKGGQGYLTLEDDRLTSRRIRDAIIDRVGADQVHLIVDACHSYFLAFSRGPGGKRRRLRGFSLGQALLDDRIGLLLSTSAARESHEWEAFQAGVFSHEVRSGLYGAADVDGDGQVSYREIAAFVHRANAAIPNERFRPRVFARPPKHERILLDLRLPRRPHLELGAGHHGRYLIETAKGVRLLDFHSGGREALRLLRPPAAGTLYLRRLTDDREYTVPPGPHRVRVASLKAGHPQVGGRGAAHHAFSKLFSRPFNRKVVAEYRPPAAVLAVGAPGSPAARSRWRTIAGWTAIGISAATLGTALYCTISAVKLQDDAPADQSHRDGVALNDSIDRRNAAAVTLYVTAGAAAAAGIITLLWPEGIGDTALAVSPGGVSLAGTF